MSGDRAIVAALVIAGAILTLKAGREGNITPRLYAGLGVVAVMLLALAMVAEDLATALAVLILVVVLLSSAEEIQGILGLIGVRRSRR